MRPLWSSGQEVGYLDSSRKPGILARIPSFSGLDTMSLVLVCTKLKTEVYLLRGIDISSKSFIDACCWVHL